MRREARNACRRISREWPAALNVSTGTLEECSDTYKGHGDKAQQKQQKPRKVQRTVSVQASCPQPQTCRGPKSLPKPKGGKRLRKWDRFRNPLLDEVEFWVPEDAAKTALERGLEGSALAASVKLQGLEDSDQEETISYLPPAGQPHCGSSLLQTLQAVLDANERPRLSQLAETTPAAAKHEQPEPSLVELPADVNIELAVEAQLAPLQSLCAEPAEGHGEDESAQPAQIPYTMDSASRVPSLLEELDWEVLTDPDSWDIISEGSFES